MTKSASPPVSAPAPTRGQPVLFWPAFLTDPPSDSNACVGLITAVYDVDQGIVRVGGFTPEGRHLVEGVQCWPASVPTLEGWMPAQ